MRNLTINHFTDEPYTTIKCIVIFGVLSEVENEEYKQEGFEALSCQFKGHNKLGDVEDYINKIIKEAKEAFEVKREEVDGVYIHFCPSLPIFNDLEIIK